MESGPKTVKSNDLKWACGAFILGVIIVLGLLLILSAGLHGATPTPAPIPTPFDASKIDFSQFTPEEIEATERHRNELKGEVREAQERQSIVIEDQGSSIDAIRNAAIETERSFNAYRSAAEAQIDKGNRAIAALDHVLKKLHLAKWILCGIWLAFTAMVVLKLPGPLKLYVGGAMAVGGVAFIWLWV